MFSGSDAISSGNVLDKTLVYLPLLSVDPTLHFLRRRRFPGCCCCRSAFRFRLSPPCTYSLQRPHTFTQLLQPSRLANLSIKQQQQQPDMLLDVKTICDSATNQEWVSVSIAAGAHSKATGRTGSGTDWASSLAAGGFTEANGRKDSKAATVSASRSLPRPNTTARGPTDCRTVTDPRPTPMEVCRQKHLAARTGAGLDR